MAFNLPLECLGNKNKKMYEDLNDHSIQFILNLPSKPEVAIGMEPGDVVA